MDKQDAVSREPSGPKWTEPWGAANPPTARAAAQPVPTRVLLPEFRRRAFLTEPGEPLLLAHNPIEAAIRFGMFAEACALPTDSLLTSRMCSVPLPIRANIHEGGHRWAGASPEMMWHPLLWMPPRLAGRYRLAERGGDGSGLLESDDLWAIRVALEMTGSGLYDDATGTWLDVLALVDIDVDLPADLARVQAWLDGAPDADLDNLDLSVHIDDPVDVTWALSSAVSMLPDLEESVWALGADSLLDVCDNLAEEVSGTHQPRRTWDDGLDAVEDLPKVGEPLGAFDADGNRYLPMTVDTARNVTATVVAVGQEWMRGVPAPGDDVAVVASPDGTGDPDPETAFWADAHHRVNNFAGTAEEFVSGPVQFIADHLLVVREQFWPRMEERIANSLPDPSVALPATSPAS